MDETLVRLVLVLGTLAVVGLVAWIETRRTRPANRVVSDTGLESGVFLLTSNDCESCERARATLARRTEYTEMSWQEAPETFQHLDIEAVPAVLVVDETGRGVLSFGNPRFVRLGGNP